MSAILTSQMVTRRALAILHNKLNFIGTINRQYDESFAKEGAKIGNQLKIRLPNQYITRTGQVATIQPTQENYTTLVMATQRGVDVDFTSQDLTLSIDDFSERILEPAMAQLSSTIEADVFGSAGLAVAQEYGDADTLATFTSDPMRYFLQAKAILNKALTPKDNKRYANINSPTMAALVYGNKALFQDSSAISEGYLEGITGRMSGLTFLENELVGTFTGPNTSAAHFEINASNISGSTLTVQVASGTVTQIPKGSVVTIAGVYDIHPETKASYPNLKQFVVTADSGAAPTSLSIDPPIIPVGGVVGTYTAGMANCSNVPSNGADVWIAGSKIASTDLQTMSAPTLVNNLVYHKDFCTFVTADLYMPKGGMELAAREVYDGVSMRLLKGFDIINDVQISRFDVLYGFKVIRPQLACRILIQN